MVPPRPPLSPEERYRVLLEIAEAANAELDFPGVLKAVFRSLNDFLRVDGVGVFTIEEGHLVPHAAYVRGIEPQPGESFVQTLARTATLTPEQRASFSHYLPLAGSATEHVGRTRQAWLCEDIAKEEQFVEDERMRLLGVRSYVRAPLFVRDKLLGSISYSRRDGPGSEPVRPFTAEEAAFLEEVSRPVASAVANSIAYQEIERLNQLLHEENLVLREEVDTAEMSGEIVGSSKALRQVLARVAKVAGTSTTVLLTGETGTGKGLIAREIHRRSPRASRALVKVNCASLPETLVASELFGHEKGAFTGAIQRRIGRFELAAGGTIFLDEVGDLPADVQVALLRVLQDGEFERVGGTETLRTDARVIAATNRDLARAAAAGVFRSDLFYRLNVFPIEVPPLAKRPEDIPILVEYFAARHGALLGKRFRRVDRRSMERLISYSWPGNVRELENVIERAAILSEGDELVVDPASLGGPGAAPLPAGRSMSDSLREQERTAIETALAEARGRVAGPNGAAIRLGLPPTTLESRIKALGISKHRFR